MNKFKRLNCSKIKKVFSVVLMSSIVASSFAPYAFASSYSSTLSFDSTCTGSTRYYSGKSIVISLHNYTSNMSYLDFKKSKYSKTYTISLYKKGWFWSSKKVGSKTVNINEKNTAKYPNIGSGDYFFFFSKSRDGINIKSNDVVMRNY